MTDERENSEMDEGVAAGYRSIAIERAPQHLNEQVLKMAANPGRNDKHATWLNSAWTKALTWAASIALCLAIVLEFTQIPEQSARQGVTDSSVREAFKPKDESTFQDAIERARLQDGTDEVLEPVTPFASPCGTDVRKSAKMWFECIRDLRAEGHALQAEREFAAFAREHPDFLP